MFTQSLFKNAVFGIQLALPFAMHTFAWSRGVEVTILNMVNLYESIFS